MVPSANKGLGEDLHSCSPHLCTVILGKCLELSEPQLLICKMGLIIPTSLQSSASCGHPSQPPIESL